MGIILVRIVFGLISYSRFRVWYTGAVMTDNQDELKQLVREAGQMALRLRSDGLEISTKLHEYDFLTEADKALDTMLRVRLHEMFPDDTIVSEESKKNIVGTSQRVWYVDPIDGTKQFQAGGDGWSVVVGAAVKGQATIGLVYHPSSDTLWYTFGSGAFRVQRETQEVISTSQEATIESSRVIKRSNIYRRFGWEDILEEKFPQKSILQGGTALRLVRLAQGDAEWSCMPTFATTPWDVCGPLAILYAAGGAAFGYHGEPVQMGPNLCGTLRHFFATNGQLAQEDVLTCAREIMQDSRAPMVTMMEKPVTAT